MSAVVDLSPCVQALYRQGHVYVSYADGKKVRFPISVNRRLRGQPEKKLNHIEIGRFGLSWPDLDEDLSHAGLRAGRFGRE
jgi:Protein of unknown function (DUF2442)